MSGDASTLVANRCSDPDLISFVVPCYNVEPFVASSILSMLGQTDVNVEVVAVDDGSTDGTWAVLQRLRARDDRLRIFRLPSNQGVVGALNHGLKQIRGQYVARCDADDVASADRSARQLAMLRSNPALGLVGCSTEQIDTRGRSIGRSDYCAGARVNRALALLECPIPHVWLARREVYDRLGGYLERAPAEDYDFLLRAISAGYAVANIALVGTRVRTRPGNTMSRGFSRQVRVALWVRLLHVERALLGCERPATQAGLARAIAREGLGLGDRVLLHGIADPSRLRRHGARILASVLSPPIALYFGLRLAASACRALAFISEGRPLPGSFAADDALELV